jgi:hypothetical protein
MDTIDALIPYLTHDMQQVKALQTKADELKKMADNKTVALRNRIQQVVSDNAIELLAPRISVGDKVESSGICYRWNGRVHVSVYNGREMSCHLHITGEAGCHGENHIETLNTSGKTPEVLISDLKRFISNQPRAYKPDCPYPVGAAYPEKSLVRRWLARFKIIDEDHRKRDDDSNDHKAVWARFSPPKDANDRVSCIELWARKGDDLRAEVAAARGISELQAFLQKKGHLKEVTTSHRNNQLFVLHMLGGEI